MPLPREMGILPMRESSETRARCPCHVAWASCPCLTARKFPILGAGAMFGSRFCPFLIRLSPAAAYAIRRARTDRLEPFSHGFAPFIPQLNGEARCDNGWLEQRGADAEKGMACATVDQSERVERILTKEFAKN